MKPAETSLPSETEVVVSCSFDAPVNLVWRAYMEPALMRRWCGCQPGWSMPVCEMDHARQRKVPLALGAAMRTARSLVSPERSWNSSHAKIVHAVDLRCRRLGVSMGSKPSIITVTFQETNGITSVTTTIRFASKADRDAALATGMTGTAWSWFHQQLDGAARSARVGYPAAARILL